MQLPVTDSQRAKVDPFVSRAIWLAHLLAQLSGESPYVEVYFGFYIHIFPSQHLLIPLQKYVVGVSKDYGFSMSH